MLKIDVGAGITLEEAAWARKYFAVMEARLKVLGVGSVGVGFGEEHVVHADKPQGVEVSAALRYFVQPGDEVGSLWQVEGDPEGPAQYLTIFHGHLWSAVRLPSNDQSGSGSPIDFGDSDETALIKEVVAWMHPRGVAVQLLRPSEVKERVRGEGAVFW